ncbi:C40 family peptidase [Arundinibacter roseus]|uniref:Glycoside hydrolase n=1 Tax=Arundinibacter roseus TaxID=2070510 RepID=A0A4R4KB44_9BACT|nr:C40 family peptidase [Arundinibacter roseus]TDB63389.1 glycoside hydrolase [Arundinibacter roseus]
MKPVYLLCVWLTCLGTGQAQTPSRMQQLIQSIGQSFAPDRRVAVFTIESNSEGALTGKTNLPAAHRALLDLLDQQKIAYVDSIEILPSKVLADNIYGVVNVSVANIRSQARDAAELATQALLGMPLRVLDKDRGWYLVQTPDHYISWIDWGGFQRMNQAEFDAWEAAPKIILVTPFAFSYEEADKTSQTVSDLVAGNRLRLVQELPAFFKVAYPDGREAFVAKDDARLYNEWLSSLSTTEESLVQTAKRMMGLPYLWGGTSFKGVDCSGFTKTIYYMNGWELPRDASQQVHTGQLLDTSDGFSGLRPGDLLFFGTKATEQTAEKVTHVGMWIGNEEFIHASGKVRISSMNSKAPNFDEFEKNRFIRAKRLLSHPQGIQSLKPETP